ncbi:MAG TPA: hypothetical protein VM222_01080 [Planctomycetota bacterium]|nr:hypothetical protein [Planctomycetota bacterium]
MIDVVAVVAAVGRAEGDAESGFEAEVDEQAVVVVFAESLLLAMEPGSK